MKNLVVYMRGGLGDIWISLCAIKPIIKQHGFSKSQITIVVDSTYFFRPHPSGVPRFLLDALYSVTPRVIIVPGWMNDNFQLSVDDVSNELSQENADKQKNIFMFWRFPTLKKMIKEYFSHDTIFIDALFTECIMNWDFKNKIYTRISDERTPNKFKPDADEKIAIDNVLTKFPKHILLHVRKKHEGTSHTDIDEYYNAIIKYCNKNNITPIVIGIDKTTLTGYFFNGTGDKRFSIEGMGYLIDKCKVMVGNDSAFSTMKLYQQQKDTLLIMNHARFERSKWCSKMFPKSNCLLLDAKKESLNKITKAIGDYYENK